MCSRHRDLRSFPTRRSSDLVGVTVAILLAAAMPLAALTGWFAAGAATRSVLLRAWVSLAWALGPALLIGIGAGRDRKSTRLNSSHVANSYAVFCLKTKNTYT